MKNQRITIRFEENEYKDLINLYKKSTHNSFSSYLRNIIFNSINNEKYIIIDTNELIEMNYQISRIGNNLNQIAKKLNQGSSVTKSDLIFLKDAIEKIKKNQKNIMKHFKEK